MILINHVMTIVLVAGTGLILLWQSGIASRAASLAEDARDAAA